MDRTLSVPLPPFHKQHKQAQQVAAGVGKFMSELQACCLSVFIDLFSIFTKLIKLACCLPSTNAVAILSLVYLYTVEMKYVAHFCQSTQS